MYSSSVLQGFGRNPKSASETLRWFSNAIKLEVVPRRSETARCGFLPHSFPNRPCKQYATRAAAQRRPRCKDRWRKAPAWAAGPQRVRPKSFPRWNVEQTNVALWEVIQLGASCIERLSNRTTSLANMSPELVNLLSSPVNFTLPQHNI